jgi:hypothetical protein
MLLSNTLMCYNSGFNSGQEKNISAVATIDLINRMPYSNTMITSKLLIKFIAEILIFNILRRNLVISDFKRSDVF